MPSSVPTKKMVSSFGLNDTHRPPSKKKYKRLINVKEMRFSNEFNFTFQSNFGRICWEIFQGFWEINVQSVIVPQSCLHNCPVCHPSISGNRIKSEISIQIVLGPFYLVSKYVSNIRQIWFSTKDFYLPHQVLMLAILCTWNVWWFGSVLLKIIDSNISVCHPNCQHVWMMGVNVDCCHTLSFVLHLLNTIQIGIVHS